MSEDDWVIRVQAAPPERQPRHSGPLHVYEIDCEWCGAQPLTVWIHLHPSNLFYCSVACAAADAAERERTPVEYYDDDGERMLTPGLELMRRLGFRAQP